MPSPESSTPPGSATSPGASAASRPDLVASAQKQRIIAPDLARGLALLGIAMANIGTAWASSEGADTAAGLGGVYEGSFLDQVAVVFSAMFVQVRGLPMFSTLLGFGVGLIAMSLWRRAYPLSSARWVLIRRYALLAGFGALHLLFLFYGDIMVLYGLCGVILALLLPLRDRTLTWIAWVLLGLQFIAFTALGLASLVFPGLEETLGTNPPIPGSYGEWLLFNLIFLVTVPLSFVPQALTLIPVMIIGFVWARRGVLTDPDSHLPLLRRWIWMGVGVVLLIGLPRGLVEIGMFAPQTAPMWTAFNTSFGLLTGPAIVAAVTLACRGLQRRLHEARTEGRGLRLSPPLTAVVALGRRSMSGYILQSLLFVLLVLPFGLGLGQEAGAFRQLLVATGIWFITLMGAYVLELAGKPGPFEWIHRRWSYGRQGLQETHRSAVVPSSLNTQLPPPAYPAGPDRPGQREHHD